MTWVLKMLAPELLQLRSPQWKEKLTWGKHESSDSPTLVIIGHWNNFWDVSAYIRVISCVHYLDIPVLSSPLWLAQWAPHNNAEVSLIYKILLPYHAIDYPVVGWVEPFCPIVFEYLWCTCTPTLLNPSGLLSSQQKTWRTYLLRTKTMGRPNGQRVKRVSEENIEQYLNVEYTYFYHGILPTRSQKTVLSVPI